MNKCKYLVASEEEWVIDATTGKQTRAQNPEPSLCDFADKQPSKLLELPRWLQRNALAGHLWRHGDCDGCPCFTAEAQHDD